MRALRPHPQARPSLRRSVLAAVAAGALLVAVSTAVGATASGPTVAVTHVTGGLNDAVSGGYEPPDVTLAAGPGFLIELVNLAARTWRTDSGTPVEVSTQTLTALFGTPTTDRLTDPRIIYDAPSGRWLASISDVDTSSVVLAVSRATDPTAGWNVVSFAAGGCADQPRMGVADGIVVLAADVFRSCDQGYSPALGGELWIVNKQQLLDGEPDPSFTTYGPDRAYDSLAPAQSLSPTATAYVAAVDVPASRVAHLLTVDGIPPAPVRVVEAATLPITPLVPPPPAQQPPSDSGQAQRRIETNDDRVLDSVWENGKLVLAANDGCIPPGDAVRRSCARVIQIATPTRSVDWDTDVSDPGSHVFFPAVRPDAAGNLLIVYGESGIAVLPELLVVARSPDGRLGTPVVIAQSAGRHEGGRYGDYFGAARDPAHPELVWVAGERGTDVEGVRGWSTAVAAAQVTAAGATVPVDRGATLPRLRARPQSTHAGTAIRLGYTALDDGVAVRQRIVVRANGSVVFSATTTAGTVVAGQDYFVVWRPAARRHGQFSWCVRSVAAGRQSPPSCATLTLR